MDAKLLYYYCDYNNTEITMIETEKLNGKHCRLFDVKQIPVFDINSNSGIIIQSLTNLGICV